EVQPGRRAPVAEQARLDVLDRQRLAQQRIVEQINLTDRQVVGGAPVGFQPREIVGSECRVVLFGHGGPRGAPDETRLQRNSQREVRVGLRSPRHERVDVNAGWDACIGAADTPQTARHDAYAQKREHVVAHGAQQVAIAGSERKRRTARQRDSTPARRKAHDVAGTGQLGLVQAGDELVVRIEIGGCADVLFSGFDRHGKCEVHVRVAHELAAVAAELHAHARVRADCLQNLRDSPLQVAARVANGSAAVNEVDPLDLPDRHNLSVWWLSVWWSVWRCFCRYAYAEHRADRRDECESPSTPRAEHDAAPDNSYVRSPDQDWRALVITC